MTTSDNIVPAITRATKQRMTKPNVSNYMGGVMKIYEIQASENIHEHMMLKLVKKCQPGLESTSIIDQEITAKSTALIAFNKYNGTEKTV